MVGSTVKICLALFYFVADVYEPQYTRAPQIRKRLENLDVLNSENDQNNSIHILLYARQRVFSIFVRGTSMLVPFYLLIMDRLVIINLSRRHKHDHVISS